MEKEKARMEVIKDVAMQGADGGGSGENGAMMEMMGFAGFGSSKK